MTALLWYALLGSCIACYILGVLHGKGKSHWRSMPVAAAAGALWPMTLLAGAWIDWYERNESA